MSTRDNACELGSFPRVFQCPGEVLVLSPKKNAFILKVEVTKQAMRTISKGGAGLRRTW